MAKSNEQIVAFAGRMDVHWHAYFDACLDGSLIERFPAFSYVRHCPAEAVMPRGASMWLIILEFSINDEKQPPGGDKAFAFKGSRESQSCRFRHPSGRVRILPRLRSVVVLIVSCSRHLV